MNDKDNLLEILRNNGDLNDVKPKSNIQLTELQLTEWLTEMKDLQEENKVLMQECDRLIKEKGELNELKEKAVSDIYRCEARLREAKRLLRLAVEDMSEKNFCVKVCKRDNFACRVSDTCDFKWRYADEAEKLLKDEELIM